MNIDFIGNDVLSELQIRYHVTEKDLGEDAHMSKNMMHFLVRVYDVKGVGNLCILTMNGMMGLMKMETVVLSCNTKDVPLLNMDTVKVMGNKTMIAEFYDTLLNHEDRTMESECQKIKDADADIPDYSSGEHWYDVLLYPCSYAKKTKGKDNRTDISLKKYFQLYLKELERAEACNPDEKMGKNRAFAQGLLDHGGPAVDSVRKLFGEEKAKKLILEYMYGIK